MAWGTGALEIRDIKDTMTKRVMPYIHMNSNTICWGLPVFFAIKITPSPARIMSHSGHMICKKTQNEYTISGKHPHAQIRTHLPAPYLQACKEIKKPLEDY